MIEIKKLSFHYKKKTSLFNDFSLEVESGSIVGLLGKNGAGKSTLLKLIAGLITPSAGKLSVNGYDPSKRSPNFLADVYMVLEEFSLPATSIGCYIKATAPLYPAFDTEKLESIFDEFELKATNKLNQLSHGQRKKFLIAFALASNCKVLILDEPTNGLDIPSKSLFRKILVSSVTDEQLVIISTHQVKDIDTIIDKIVAIDNGTIVYKENTSEISQKLHFETTTSLNDAKDVIYHERCPMGYRIIVPTTDHNESEIDMELLFNAIINKKI